MLTMRNTYPATGDGRFDEHYFLTHHVPLARQILGDEVLAVRVLQPVQVAGQPPAPRMIVEFDFPSREAMNRAVANPRMAELRDDVANYTDVRGSVSMLDDGL